MIIIGFLSNAVFKITKIPSTIILICMGILIGPVFGLIDTPQIAKFAGHFGTFALILILLEGGLELEIKDIIEQLGLASLLGILVFGLSVFCLTFYFCLSLDYPTPFALLVSAILSGTSPAIVFPTVSKLNIEKDLKTLLNLEATVSEVFCVIIVIMTIQFIDYDTGLSEFSKRASFLTILTKFFEETTIALLLAIVFGGFWSRLMALFGDQSLSYILTLGVTILLFSLTELCGGKGALAVLFFGVFLTNATWIVRNIKPYLKKYVPKFHISERKFLVSEKISHT
ncbi:MAG: cation:proton antiporter, partial [Silvanigrellaceae bacterium]|nr:cation:proton antiporter [Silvanigrellaceae bacterium]